MAVSADRLWFDTARVRWRGGGIPRRTARIDSPAHARARTVRLAAACGGGCACAGLTAVPALTIRDAGNGYLVTAIDISLKWSAGPSVGGCDRGPHRPTIYCRSIDQRTFEPGTFDAVFSNFGPLNCVDDLDRRRPDPRRPAARRCWWHQSSAASVRGKSGFICLAEMLRAVLRFRQAAVPVPLKDGTVWTLLHAGATGEGLRALRFHAPRTSGSRCRRAAALLEAFAARRPQLVGRLLRLDGLVGAWPGVRGYGDHF